MGVLWMLVFVWFITVCWNLDVWMLMCGSLVVGFCVVIGAFGGCLRYLCGG